MVEDEKIDEIIEEKVRERLDKKVEEEVSERVEEKVERHISQHTSSTEDSEEDSEQSVSRRGFLKKMGAGAAGLGALTMLPSASAFNIRTSNPLNYYGDDQNNPNFSVQPDGTLQADSINASNEFTDPNGTSHTGELADSNDVSNIQSSSDVTVTDTSVGTLSDGQFLKNNGGTMTGDTPSVSGVPTGAIIMWSGSTTNIPNGWTLCDGNNENGQTVPDLRNRFIVGAGDQYSVGNTGGEKQVQLTKSEMPSHDHGGSTSSDGSHNHESNSSGSAYGYSSDISDSGSYWGAVNMDDFVQQPATTTSNGSHSHSINSSGSDSSHENRPPYFALAYIMKI